MNYTLGVDIGIASVGFCVIDENKKRIENLGVRIFDAAEQPKTGESLAKPRRDARGKRRTLRRKAHRLQRIRQLFVKYKLANSLQNIMDTYNNHTLQDPWALRVQGLERKLNQEEWVKVLSQLAKRRGFKSNRKSELKEAEVGAMYKGINENKALMIEKGYRTVGELLLNHKKVDDAGNIIQNKRNKGKESYINSVSRDLLIQELNILFETQRNFKNEFATEEFEKEYMEIYENQRKVSEGDDIEKLVGKCTFEKEELRAAKACLSSELFVAWQKLNNLRLTGGKKELTKEEKDQIIKLLYNKKGKEKEIKYSHIRKELNIAEDIKFAGVDYIAPKSKKENVKLLELKAYHKIKSEVTESLGKDYFNKINNKKDIDTIATVLSLKKTDEDITNELRNYSFDENLINVLLNLSFSKFGHLSLKAINNILPYLEQGMVYSAACEKAGYNHWDSNINTPKTYKLPTMNYEDLTNPVFKRAVSQTTKVINAIIYTYGSPTQINIEVARDLAKSKEERDKISKMQDTNKAEREKAVEELKATFGLKDPKGKDILKWRLWRQQEGICMYSGKTIPPESLFALGLEIDHIIPYSRSFDDSMANKVLVLTAENQNKGNNIPAEYFGIGTKKWEDFAKRVSLSKLPYKKKEYLLKTEFTTEDKNKFKERNLNDTKYIARFMSNHIKAHLIFKETQDEKVQKVIMVPGQLTAMLRGRWGLKKIRDEGDLHHALDAAVVAVSTQRLIGIAANLSKYDNLRYEFKNGHCIDKETGEIMDTQYKKEYDNYFEPPWKEFKDELEIRLSPSPSSLLEKANLPNYLGVDLNTIKPVFVSKMPYRKVTGQIHEETIRSAKFIEANKAVSKKRLAELNYATLEKMFDKERNKKLYNALKERLDQHDGDAKKAFNIENPFFKPTNNGQRGPLVRSIKIEETKNTGVYVNGGIADNGKMVRVDIFKKDVNYFVVPVYVKDVMKKVLPNKAIVAGKTEDEWTIMDDTYTFCFSLYKNDLVYIKKKKDNFEMFGYYNTAHRGNGRLYIKYHDRNKEEESFTTKTGILEFKKYNVDILGNKYEIKGEKRLGF